MRKAESGEYVIIIDGDLILHRDFLWDHIKAWKKGALFKALELLVSKGEKRKKCWGRTGFARKIYFGNRKN